MYHVLHKNAINSSSASDIAKVVYKKYQGKHKTNKIDSLSLFLAIYMFIIIYEKYLNHLNKVD